MTIYTIVTIICLSFSVFINNISQLTIKSDLAIPVDSVLLKRPRLVSQIEEKLKDETQNSISSVVIVGIGGAGKTTLARYYARFHPVSVVWEINAERKENLLNSFKSLAYALATSKELKEDLRYIQEIPDSEERGKQILVFVKKQLKHQSNWILIYDNVENPEDINAYDIKTYLPNDPEVWGHGKVIITTRNNNFQNNSYIAPNHVVQVDQLTEEEVLELFSKIYYGCESTKLTQQQKEKALTFLSQIPPFPLDISVAAYYIKDTKISFEAYLERINQYSKSFENMQQNFVIEMSVNNYSKTRYGIVTSSLEKMIETNKDFVNLLLFVSLLGSQNIPRELLNQCKSNIVIDDFIRHLRRYSLTIDMPLSKKEFEINTLSFHRSTQAIAQFFLLNLLKDKNKEEFLREFIESIKSYYLAYVERENENIVLLLPHLIVLIKNLKKVNLEKRIKDKYEQELYYILGYGHLKHSNNMLLAKKYLLRAYELRGSNKAFSTSSLAILLKDLADIFLYLCLPKESQFYSQESIKLCEILPDSDELRVSNYTILGYAYTIENNFAKASEVLEKALSYLSRPEFDTRSELVADVYASLAYLYSVFHINKEEGRQAIVYAQKALSIFDGNRRFYNERVSDLDKSLASIAKYKRVLGHVYCRLGHYKEAREEGFREAEYIMASLKDPQNLLKSITDLGVGEVLLREEKVEAAEEKLTDSITESIKLMGENDTVDARILRAEARLKLGKLEEAYDDCLEVFRIGKVYSTNYSDLIYISCFYHAGFIKYRQKDFEKAVEYFSKFFEQMEPFCKGFLKDSHFERLKTRSVFCVRSFTSPEQLEVNLRSYLQQSLDIFTVIYGPDHPFVKNYLLQNCISAKSYTL